MKRFSYDERDYAFGQMMLTLRTRIGLTQKNLAERLNVSRRTLADWEGGVAYPKAEHLKAFMALCVRNSVFDAGHEEEQIRVLWRTARQKMLLDEHWLQELLGRSSPSTATLPGKPFTSGRQGSTAASDSALWTVPYKRNPHFTGRDELLSALMAKLAPPVSGQPATLRCTVLTQAQVIKGLGGIGKTQTAVEYAYRARAQGRYTCTFWIVAASEETILTSFTALAELLPDAPSRGETDQRKLVAAVLRWLEHCQQPWLLIYDNADDLSLVQSYLPVRGNGSVLLTTRASATGWLAPSLEVEVMGESEAIELLLRRAQRFAHATNEEMNEAANLVAELALFPLALDQAGAYIEETGCSVREYQELYQTHRGTLLSRRGRQAIGYPASVATTWALSFEHIARTNQATAELLQLCAFLAPDRIPEELLTEGAPHWSPALQQAVADPFTFNQLLESLLAFSLVKRLSEDRLLSVHRLVQAVQVERLTPEEQRQWTRRLVQAVNAVFPREPQKIASWSACQRYLDQVQACLTLIEQQQMLLPEAADVFDRAGDYLYERALYALAEPLYQQALSIREQLLGEAHPISVQSMRRVASIFVRQGKYTEAEALYQQALPIAEQLAESEQSLLVDVLRGLAHVYVDQGKDTQAKLLYRRALHIGEQQLGPEHLLLVNVLNGLAFALAHMGKYVEAELFQQRALHIREQQLGPEHLDVAYALIGLAQITTMKGEDTGVEPLLQRVLYIREKQLGGEHPLIAFPLDALARLYVSQDKYAEAEAFFQRALLIREQQLGPESIDVSDSLRGLADLYLREGKYAEAEPLFQRALHIRERLLGTDNALVADVLIGLAHLYFQQRAYMQAEPLFQRTLRICEQQMGYEHLVTSEALHDFAGFRHEQGHTQEAASLYQRALTIRENVLGADHPLTTDTREHLHEVLVALGQA